MKRRTRCLGIACVNAGGKSDRPHEREPSRHENFHFRHTSTRDLLALVRPQGNDDIRSVVMINCGAICNVVDLLSQLSPEAYVYIVDSNRPVHLANVYPTKDR